MAFGCLSEPSSKWFAHGPADATPTSSPCASLKSRVVNLRFWCQLTKATWKLGGQMSAVVTTFSALMLLAVSVDRKGIPPVKENLFQISQYPNILPKQE